MDIKFHVNFTMTPTNRTVLNNVFWIKSVKSQPAISVVNLEIFNNGVIVFNIDPAEDEPYREKYYLDDLQYELIQMTNGVFDGLKIDKDMFFVLPKEELTKIRFANVNNLEPVPSNEDYEFEGKNLCESNNLTTLRISKFSEEIKNEFLDLIGFPKFVNTESLKRLVFFGAYHYDQMFSKGSLNYCNLEIYPNGQRRFEKGESNSMFSPDNLLTVYELVPLASGNFTVLIIKIRRKTEDPNIFTVKDFYIVPNQEAKKFQNINIEKDLYRLVEDNGFPGFNEINSFFEGQKLEISSDYSAPLLNYNVKNEFLQLIQNSK